MQALLQSYVKFIDDHRGVPRHPVSCTGYTAVVSTSQSIGDACTLSVSLHSNEVALVALWDCRWKIPGRYSSHRQRCHLLSGSADTANRVKEIELVVNHIITIHCFTIFDIKFCLTEVHSAPSQLSYLRCVSATRVEAMAAVYSKLLACRQEFGKIYQILF